MLIVASLWYLLFTSILMVGQYFLEKRFARGLTRIDAGAPVTTEAIQVQEAEARAKQSLADGESGERR